MIVQTKAISKEQKKKTQLCLNKLVNNEMNV